MNVFSTKHSLGQMSVGFGGIDSRYHTHTQRTHVTHKHIITCANTTVPRPTNTQLRHNLWSRRGWIVKLRGLWCVPEGSL